MMPRTPNLHFDQRKGKNGANQFPLQREEEVKQLKKGVEAVFDQTHHRIAKVASLQEKQRCFRHFISIMKTTLSNIKRLGSSSVG